MAPGVLLKHNWEHEDLRLHNQWLTPNHQEVRSARRQSGKLGAPFRGKLADPSIHGQIPFVRNPETNEVKSSSCTLGEHETRLIKAGREIRDTL